MNEISKFLAEVLLKNREDFYLAIPFYIFAGLSLVKDLGWIYSFVPFAIFFFTNIILDIFHSFYLRLKKFMRDEKNDNFYFYTTIISLVLFLLGSYIIVNFIIINHNKVLKLPGIDIFKSSSRLGKISSNIFLGIAYILHIEQIKMYDKRMKESKPNNLSPSDYGIKENVDDKTKVTDYPKST